MPAPLPLPLLLALGVARAETWPEDGDWQVAQRDGAPLSDPCEDVSGSDWWDIVGDASDPVAYTAWDGTNLWFRMRVHGEPARTTGSGSWRCFCWRGSAAGGPSACRRFSATTRRLPWGFWGRGMSSF